MNNTVSLANLRTMRDAAATLRKILPSIELLANEGGCGVSIFFRDYINRALTDPLERSILRWSYPDWEYGDGENATVTIRSRASDWKGTFLICRRVIRDDVVFDEEKSKADWMRFSKYAVAHFEDGAMMSPASVAVLVFGTDLMRMLGAMRPYLIEYRQDKGSHLLFLEHPGSKRYLEIYLGQWLDESEYNLNEWRAKAGLPPIE